MTLHVEQPLGSVICPQTCGRASLIASVGIRLGPAPTTGCTPGQGLSLFFPGQLC